MKYIIVVLMLISMTSCAIHFKGTDVELDTEPSEPGVVLHSKVFEFEKIGLYDLEN